MDYRTASVCFLGASSLALLNSCAQYQWQKAGASQQDFSRDSYQCQIEAARAFPSAIVTQQITAGYTTPAMTNCYGSGSAYGSGSTVYGSTTTNCTTTPGQSVAPLALAVDANKSNREQVTNACMFARGWQLIQLTSNGGGASPASGITCQSDSDCRAGQSCRSRSGSGTECRASSSNTMSCQSDSDCRTGESCRSRKGGGTECRTTSSVNSPLTN